MEAWSLDAAGLARAYREGALTPTEALESCLARCEAVNPRLNAIVTFDRDGARAAAAAEHCAVAGGQAARPAGRRAADGEG